MRAASLFVCVVAVTGCTADASGLGDELDPAEAGIADSTASGYETRPLFDAEDDDTRFDAARPDVRDSGVRDGVVDSKVADTIEDTAKPDTTPDADSTAPDIGRDGGIVSTPGRVPCGGVVCRTGEVCCGGGTAWRCSAMDCAPLEPTYRCDEKADCPVSQVCCVDLVTLAWNGSQCAASCGSYELCSSSAECSGGKTCDPTPPPGATYPAASCR